MRLGGLETGGTKMVLGLGNEKGELLARHAVETRMPEDTIPEIIEWFKDKNIDALGIGSFGPLDIAKGMIAKTPKQGWDNTELVRPFKEALNVPVGFDTDVNAAMLGEAMFGAASDVENAIYITIGTGIGFGVYVDGKLLHGVLHPEAGHMLLTRVEGDTYEGSCRFHDHCFEGLASGPAIYGRWNAKGEDLYDRDEVWELESEYIAQALCNAIMCYSPERIIIGGGVMHNQNLYGMIREKTKRMLNGYIGVEQIESHIDDYIVAPKLGDNAGVLGSMMLGYRELKKETV